MVKESALPTGLRVLVWCVVVLVCGGVTVVCVVYRKEIRRGVVTVMEAYRMRRRRRVCEELVCREHDVTCRRRTRRIAMRFRSRRRTEISTS